MLRAELAGEPYSKADHNRALQPLLDGRSRSSVEFKHQNISAVLADMNQPYIAGYKPARNYQKAVLPEAVDDYLIRHPDMLEALAESPVLNPKSPPTISERPAIEFFEPPPERIIVPQATISPGSQGRARRSTSPAGTPQTGCWGNSVRSSPSRSRSGV